MSKSAAERAAQQKSARPPHIWNRHLYCVYCGWASYQALQRQPDTLGVGPCPKRGVRKKTAFTR